MLIYIQPSIWHIFYFDSFQKMVWNIIKILRCIWFIKSKVNNVPYGFVLWIWLGPNSNSIQQNLLNTYSIYVHYRTKIMKEVLYSAFKNKMKTEIKAASFHLSSIYLSPIYHLFLSIIIYLSFMKWNKKTYSNHQIPQS